MFEKIPMWTLALVKKRGWTDAMVRDFLGDPDARGPNPHYRAAGDMRLYNMDRVLAAESLEVWQVRRARAEHRGGVIRRARRELVRTGPRNRGAAPT
jgi:hypothetical protein